MVLGVFVVMYGNQHTKLFCCNGLSCRVPCGIRAGADRMGKYMPFKEGGHACRWQNHR